MEIGDHSPRRPNRRGGFTMIELATVMTIMGVVAAMAVPRYGSFIAQERLEAAARRISADLTLAQRQARTAGVQQQITFSNVTHKYTVGTVKNMDHPGELYVVSLADEPYGGQIVSADFGGNADVIFDGYGAPDTGGSVTIRVGSRQKTIDLDAGTGRPKIQKFVILEVQ